ncbi:MULTISPECIES: hypothetical protein [Chitinophagaceae]|uniref:hypothetical protein n=1 Tax=Chitinophagaceae TaxID=563835 RepID=UPI000DEF28CF|nr:MULTISPECIES: hypothetical protein [Chitinophagaceae]RPD51259.1 hypothetical protein DRJ53_00840 [Paracnuella aquatica]
MKKFFAIAAIAGTLVACGNASEAESTVDSTAVAPLETAPVDTTATAVDSTGAAIVDSAAAAVDSAK